MLGEYTKVFGIIHGSHVNDIAGDQWTFGVNLRCSPNLECKQKNSGILFGGRRHNSVKTRIAKSFAVILRPPLKDTTMQKKCRNV